MKIDQKEVLKRVKEVFGYPNVRKPSVEEMREEAIKHGVVTEDGSIAFFTSVRNRSAKLTYLYAEDEKLMNSLDWTPQRKKLLQHLPETLELVFEYLKKAPLIQHHRNMGVNPDFNPHMHLLFSIARRDTIRVPYMWTQSLPDFNPDLPGPELYMVYIPEWQEKDRQIIVFPEINVTFVLGTDYYGEIKKGFLRMAMYRAKVDKGYLGLHAGAKLARVRDKDGKLRTYSILLFGLSGTGKTTHSVHPWGLNPDEGERVWIVQDDFVALRPDGSAYGTEIGFFIKTDGLDRNSQPLIYDSARKPSALLENALVDWKGRVYFQDLTLTGNGRGIIQWSDLGEWKSESINLPPLSEIDGLIFLFITRRNDILPMIQKLDPTQAAATFMLGESIETSAGDPTKVGQSVRVVGTNPFIVGPEEEEGNIFYDLYRGLPQEKVQAYLMNTGTIGERCNDKGTKPYKIRIRDNAAVIRAIMKRTIEWKEHPKFKTLIPKYVPDLDLSPFDLSNYYTEATAERLIEELIKERKEYMKKFRGLYPEIVKAVNV